MNLTKIKEQDYENIESLSYVEFGNVGQILAYVSDKEIIDGIVIGHWVFILIADTTDVDKIGELYDKLTQKYLKKNYETVVSTGYLVDDHKHIFRTISNKDKGFSLLRFGNDAALTFFVENGAEKIFAEGPVKHMEILAGRLMTKQ